MENKGKFFKESILKKIKPLDLIIVIMVIGAGVFCLFKTSSFAKGDTVLVKTGTDSYEYSLSQNGQYQVKGEIGITTILIEDGRVKIIDSPCPHKTCINQGFGTTLVCLPNQVFVTVQQKNGEFDAIVQ